MQRYLYSVTLVTDSLQFFSWRHELLAFPRGCVGYAGPSHPPINIVFVHESVPVLALRFPSH